MGRPCTICSHSQHERINIEMAAGASIKGLGRKYSVSRQALGRHRANCVARLVAAAKAAKNVPQQAPSAPQISFNELSRERQLQMLKGRALQLLGIADRASDIRAALAAIQQLTQLIADEDKPSQRPGARNGTGDPQVVIYIPDNGRDRAVMLGRAPSPTKDEDDTETND